MPYTLSTQAMDGFYDKFYKILYPFYVKERLLYTVSGVHYSLLSCSCTNNYSFSQSLHERVSPFFFATMALRS
jgi:hypothetical protein